VFPLDDRDLDEHFHCNSESPQLIARCPGMATTKQRTAAKENIKKASSSAKRKKTISKLPKSTRTALGKQANKVKKQKSGSR
jgi:hypothetical protein